MSTATIRATIRQRQAMAAAFGHRAPRIKRAVQLKPARWPSGIRNAYLRELLDIVSVVRTAIERIVVPQLPHLVAMLSAGQLAQLLDHWDRMDALARADALEHKQLFFRRIAIIGGPRTGKTTAGRALAHATGLELHSSDDLIKLGWSESSTAVAAQIAEAGASDGHGHGGVFEGVAVVRALRKLLKSSPDKPVDSVIVLLEPQVDLTDGQRTMTTAARTLVREVLGPLMARGVDVTYSLDEHLAQPEYAAHRAALQGAPLRTQRTDADPSDPLGAMFDDVAEEVGRAVPDARVLQAANTTGKRIAQHVRTEVDGQLKQLVGVDVFGGDQGLADHISAFSRQQLLLVRSLIGTTLDKTHASVIEGLRQGLRVEALQKKLRDEVGLSKTKATIIANDQVGKLNGELTRLRQVNLGVRKYRWITARDELVRPGHKALDGTTQSWDAPPIVNAKTGKRAHPGFDTHFYPCRCSAAPDVEDLLTGLGVGGGDDDEGDELVVPKVPTKPPANVPPPPEPTPRKARVRRPKPPPSAALPLPPEHTPEHYLAALEPTYGPAAPQVAWGRAMGARGEALELGQYFKGLKDLNKSGIEAADPRDYIFVKDLIRKQGAKTVGELAAAIENDPDVSNVRRAIARELRVGGKLIAHKRALKGLVRDIELQGPLTVTTKGLARERIESARERVRRIYSQMTHREISHPTHAAWVADDNARASYSHHTRILNIGAAKPNVDDHELLEAALHEWGHGLEYLNPRMLGNAVEFLDHRTAGEPLVQMAKLFPRSNYGPHEVTRPDKLFEAYMGSHYADTRAGSYKDRDATEVTSMAVQHLHNVTTLTSSVHTKDPDTLDWLLGQLANQ